HIDGHGYGIFDTLKGRVPAVRRSFFEKRARHPFTFFFACDLTRTFLTTSTIFAMEVPRAAIFAVTTRPVQAFRNLKLEAKRALLKAKRVTSLNDPLPDRPRGDSDNYRLVLERAIRKRNTFFINAKIESTSTK
ncbi:hypothetical protein PspLS_10077, partial [Pyricularia sp. CBS 133598]